MDFAQKRWIALVAAMICALFAGVIYTWSVYVNPLSEMFGWSTSSISLAYTINIIFSAIIPVTFVKVRAKLGIANYNLLGAFVFGLGMLLCSTMKGSIWELYLYFGVLVGGGIGFIYVSLVSYVVQLFPDKRGLAAGLYTAAYGCAALIWAPWASNIIQTTGNPLIAFRTLGIVMTIVIIIGTRFLYNVPEGWAGVPSKETEDKPAKPVAPAVSEKRTVELFSSPLFYVVLIMFTCGLISGSMILALGSPILQGSLGYTPAKAAVVVGLFAVAQTFGRLFWGWISDAIGRMNVVTSVGVLTVLALLIMIVIKTEWLYIIAILIVPMAYGAYASMLSPLTVETFGSKHFTSNYNVLFYAFAFAALIGPQIVAYFKGTPGGYETAFIWAVGFASLAIILSFVYRSMAAKEREKNAGIPA